MTSDRGPQFRSKLFDEICRLLGVDTVKTTSYNPKSNGIVERMQRVLKNSLKCRGKKWLIDLPFVLLGLHTSAEMTYGCSLRLPGEFFVAGPAIDNESVFARQLRSAMAKIRPPPFKHKNNTSFFVSPDLFTAKKVYLRVDRVKEPLELPYEGPYEVLKRRKKYFKLRLPKKDDFVSIDRLKPAYELSAQDLPSNVTSTPTSILKKTNFDVNSEMKQTGDVSNEGKRTLYVKIPKPQVTFAQPLTADSNSVPSESQPGPSRLETSNRKPYLTKKKAGKLGRLRDTSRNFL